MNNYTTKIVTTKAELNGFYNTSALTLEGLTADDENLSAFAEWINGIAPSKNITFNIISGKLMNESYKLTGTNAYPDDLTIVSVTGVDTCKLSIPRFQIGARWFDDIVDNNKERQKKRA